MEVNVCLCPVTGVVTRKQNVCVMSYLSRQNKFSTLNNSTPDSLSNYQKLYIDFFFVDIIHYTLFNYKILVIT